MASETLRRRNKGSSISESEEIQTQAKPDDEAASSAQPKDVKDSAGKKRKENRFSLMPSFATQRVWTRCVLVISIVIYVWFANKNKETVFGRQKDPLDHRAQTVVCDDDYSTDVAAFDGCVPAHCGRFATDQLLNEAETDTLLQMAQRGIGLGGSDGGASILDLHSGALSYGANFINIYKLMEKKSEKIFSESDLKVYRIVKDRIKNTIAQIFKMEAKALHLTHPTFFSRLTSDDPKTDHDEYWHPHVDKVTYESFHYTSLVYLSDFGIDFKGGRFIWLDEHSTTKAQRNVTLEPRRGRVAIFTSGAENRHMVERVTTGTRYAITVSFTCDPSKAIGDLEVR